MPRDDDSFSDGNSFSDGIFLQISVKIEKYINCKPYYKKSVIIFALSSDKYLSTEIMSAEEITAKKMSAQLTSADYESSEDADDIEWTSADYESSEDTDVVEGFWLGPYNVWVPNAIKSVTAWDGENTKHSDGTSTKMMFYPGLKKGEYRKRYATYDEVTKKWYYRKNQ